MFRFLVRVSIELSGFLVLAVSSLLKISDASEGLRYPCVCKKDMLACV